METGIGILRRFPVLCHEGGHFAVHRLLIKGCLHMGCFAGEEGLPPLFPPVQEAAGAADGHGFVYALFIVVDAQFLECPRFVGRILRKFQFLPRQVSVFLPEEFRQLRPRLPAGGDPVHPDPGDDGVPFDPNKRSPCSHHYDSQ